jgi:hypothetical protein
MDLDVELKFGEDEVVGDHVIVLPGKESAMAQLATSLPRSPFSLDLVSRLYRFSTGVGFAFTCTSTLTGRSRRRRRRQTGHLAPR